MNTEEAKDYFEHYEELTGPIRTLVDEMGEACQDGLNYKELANYLEQFEAIGWTFDYGLSAEAYDLRPIKYEELEIVWADGVPGTIVHIHGDQEAFEVELFDGENTIGVKTFMHIQLSKRN